MQAKLIKFHIVQVETTTISEQRNGREENGSRCCPSCIFDSSPHMIVQHDRAKEDTDPQHKLQLLNLVHLCKPYAHGRIALLRW